MYESTSDFGALQSSPKSKSKIKSKSKSRSTAKVDQEEEAVQSTTFEVLEGKELRSTYFDAIRKNKGVKGRVRVRVRVSVEFRVMV